MKHDLNYSDLDHFSGTDVWYRHGVIRNVVWTEGVEYLAQHGGAYWLIDEVATNQVIPAVRKEGFQVWTLTVSRDRTATLVCDDGNSRIVFSKAIEYTDFPLQMITLYCTDNVISLPREY